jgi:hypothetical protein
MTGWPRLGVAVVALLAAALLTGCGEDEPVDDPLAQAPTAVAPTNGSGSAVEGECVSSYTDQEPPYEAGASIEVSGAPAGDYQVTAVFTAADTGEELGRISGPVTVPDGGTGSASLRGNLSTAPPEAPEGFSETSPVDCTVEAEPVS